MKFTFLGNHSSMIRVIGWEHEILTIVYQNKRHYEYYAVLKKVFLDFTSAESPGKYYHEFVKDKFHYAEIIMGKE